MPNDMVNDRPGPEAKLSGLALPAIHHISRPRVLRCIYTNHRGEVAERRIMPHFVWFGSTQWHPRAQYLLRGYDLGRTPPAIRDFAMCDMQQVVQEEPDVIPVQAASDRPAPVQAVAEPADSTGGGAPSDH